MKKTVLYAGLFIVISTLLDSCVSRKKFEDLARAKREVDRNLLDIGREKSQLEQELKLAKDDFNAIRYKLTENNAAKDSAIDQLYNKLRSLESKQVELKSELTDVAEQIRTTTQTSGEQIATLENNLQKVTTDRDNIKKQMTEIQTRLEFEKRQLKTELEKANSMADAKENEIEKLKADQDELNKKLNWIRKTKTEADAEIKKLTNQVNLLKKELEKK